ncbi:MAG: phosphotransferase, partial [Planctomycetota bacterium]|nr:phosphotransferase [Planctomycetota bacterium]
MDAADLKADRPDLTCEEAALVARTHSGALVSVEELPSDRDRNFRLTARDGERSVLKVAALAETREVLALENLVMARAHAAGVPVPLVLPDVDGELLRAVTLSDGRTHWVRRISWLPGRPLAEVRPKSAEVLGELGALLGRLDLELAQIADPAVQRELFWDLRSAARSFDPAQAVMANAERRGLFERWRERLAPTLVLLDELPRQLIQNDANDYNVLVEESLDGQRISGLLDFGDCVWTARAAEPAIAMAYAMLDAPDPVGCGLALAGGYCSAFPLEDRELELLFELAALRLMHSVANSALRMAEEPDDAYLTISEAPAWRLLERMLEVPQAEGAARLRLAAGLELGGPSLPANALAGWLPLGEVHPLDLSLTSPPTRRATPGRSCCAGSSRSTSSL